MKHYIKNIICAFIILCGLTLTGCKNISFDITGKEAKNNNKANTESYLYNENEVEDSKDDSKEVKKSKTKKENSKQKAKDEKKIETGEEEKVGIATESNMTTGNSTITIQPVKSKDLMIYTVNGNAEIEAAIAAVPQEKTITPELIVTLVTESLMDNSLNVGIDSVTSDGDTVIVSFLSDQPPVATVGGGYEGAILDAIAQSLTDNLSNYSKVVYRVEGGPYTSGHMELDLNEVYHMK